MYRILLFIVFLFNLQFVKGQDIPGLMFGGTDNDIGTAICHTEDEGFLLLGTTRSYGNGSEDVYLLRLDKNFNLLWEKIIGWEHSDRMKSVIQVNDGFMLCGGVWDYGMAGFDISLLKISDDGDLIWKKFYGSHSLDRGVKLLQSADSNLIIMGYSRENDNRGDIIVIKTNKDGEEIWRNYYGYERDDYGFDMFLDEDEKIYVFGSKNGFYDDVHVNFQDHDADYFLIKIDEDGNEVLRKSFGGDGHDFGSGIIKKNGELICVGSSQSISNGSFDLSINILTEDTTIISTENYGGAEYEYGTAISLNNENNYFVLGTTKSFGQNNSADVYLLKFDSDNSLLWETTFGGLGIDYGKALVSTDDGGCAILCESNSYEDGSFNLLFIKINSIGQTEDIVSIIDFNLIKNRGVIHPNPITRRGRLIVPDNKVEYIIQFYKISGGIISETIVVPPNFGLNVENLQAGIYAYRVTQKGNSSIMFSGVLIKY